MIGFNYRMPNLNAALLCAQMELLDEFIKNKRELANKYLSFFKEVGIEFFSEPRHSYANYWLNAIILPDRRTRDIFLNETNDAGVMTRPIWTLMNKTSMFKNCNTDKLEISNWLEDRIVNIPSSVRT